MSAEEKKLCDEAMEKALIMLGEYFDSVQIMCSVSESGVTNVARAGSGNWYARQGMAHEFINMDMAQENAKQIAEAINPEEE